MINLPAGYYMKRKDSHRLLGNDWQVVVYCDPDCKKQAFHLAKVYYSPEYNGVHYMATLNKQIGTVRSRDLDELMFQMAARHRVMGGMK